MKNQFPLSALRSRQWFKLICGASYQYLPAIRNLAFLYTAGGANCIDVAADPVVVGAAKAGIEAAQKLYPGTNPWLMVSINSGEDLHFRKAQFKAQNCLDNCPTPCKQVCPADAIDVGGVITDRCYGCGRCLSVCPIGIIDTYEHTYDWHNLIDLPIDALEIHTQSDRWQEFGELWQNLASWINQLELVSVSFPDHPRLAENLTQLLKQMQPKPKQLIWQTDGRPMSGDIGGGTTHNALRLGEKIAQMGLPGFIQLAGGTNDTTVAKLKSRQLSIHGVAYGSYARTLVAELLDGLPGGANIEDYPSILSLALDRVAGLIEPLKILPLNTSSYVGHLT